MNTGAFVCSCGGTCDIDLEQAREGVRDVDVVASSELLCEDGLPAMEQVIEEYDLDQLIVTTPEPRCQSKFTDLAERKGLHPDAAAFVDHREGAGWIHEESDATDKTARLINATHAGLREESVSRTVSRETGRRVAVVGDAETAAALSDTAEVTLIADGREFAGADVDLDDVTIERGRVGSIEGEYGDFELTLAARVTEDCISCMECVKEGPDGMVTSYPVDIDPDAPEGEWTDVCPTDAIDMEGVERTLEADQVVHPGGTSTTRGGRIGFYTTADAGTIAAVEGLLDGVTKPAHLDLEMEVCASGASSQKGCNECVEACPHGAVERPSRDSVAFDEVACQDCGACTSSCPTGAVSLREPSNERIAREVEALLETDADGGWFSRGRTGIDTEIVAFVCSERAKRTLAEYGRRARRSGATYPPLLPVNVNCADTIGEAHVMHALAAGADGVAIVGCGDACLHSGPDPKAELTERLTIATTDLGLGERVTFFAPEADDPDAFADALSEFSSGLDPSPVPSGGHEATGGIDAERSNPPFDSHGWTLESVREIIDHTDPEREVIRGLKDFGLMEVDDTCTLNPTCSSLCPTDAIDRTDDGDLLFNHELCVNCGLCEEGCPETAITMETGLDRSLLPENRDGENPAWTTVYEGEMVECVRCGKPFTSAESVEKVESEVGDLVEGVAPNAEHSVFEYCGDCRAKLMFEGR
jgi:Fe-S-cluster-containing hydrogenase component 2